MYIFLVLPKLGHVGKLFATGVIIATKDYSGVRSKVAIKCIVLENLEGNQFRINIIGFENIVQKAS